LIVAACSGTTETSGSPAETNPNSADGAVAGDAQSNQGKDARGDGAEAYDAGAMCAQLQKRDSACEAGATSGDGCQWLVCYGTLFNASDARELVECISTRECGVSDDRCMAQVSAKYQSDSAALSFMNACLEKRAACRDAGAGYSDDYCAFGNYALVQDKAAMSACLQVPCSEFRGCFAAITTAAGCPAK
jgi:hypothetical protein